eukprot:CAMPEP_0117684582 /NCGR_PEP_ID=MMETSP0804-20121206/21185_1 /TAXON_ID=1074897 /ORGANISM="Tetraselmis astigmatica, Strain CCMP880" /LENGTH=166 /DNA_ID=CAMNT_0005495601 /DNA_START=258 /DNA_END=756 /DNA_ORIENTATION=+
MPIRTPDAEHHSRQSTVSNIRYQLCHPFGREVLPALVEDNNKIIWSEQLENPLSLCGFLDVWIACILWIWLDLDLLKFAVVLNLATYSSAIKDAPLLFFLATVSTFIGTGRAALARFVDLLAVTVRLSSHIIIRPMGSALWPRGSDRAARNPEAANIFPESWNSQY